MRQQPQTINYKPQTINEYAEAEVVLVEAA